MSRARRRGKEAKSKGFMRCHSAYGTCSQRHSFVDGERIGGGQRLGDGGWGVGMLQGAFRVRGAWGVGMR